MTEAELKKAVVDYAHQQGWHVYSQPMARTKRPVKDASGYPDLTLARDGRVLWIELKQEDGTISEAQHDWLRALSWDRASVIRPSDWDSGFVQRLLG